MKHELNIRIAASFSAATPEDAALAYDYAARLLFEAFARPNFLELVAPPEIEAYVQHRLDERGIDMRRKTVDA